MVLLQFAESLVKTCKHLAVSPMGLAQPAEPLHLINALGYQQIKITANSLDFFQLKIFPLLPNQLSPGSCMTFVISPCCSSPFCLESTIYCLLRCGACLLPVSMPSRSSIVFIQLVEPALYRGHQES